MVIGIIIVVIVVLIILFLVFAYNGLVKSRNRIDNAWSQIDVQLKRRYDLIPNLVETAKGYMKHESGTLEAVIAARNVAQCGQQLDTRVGFTVVPDTLLYAAGGLALANFEFRENGTPLGPSNTLAGSPLRPAAYCCSPQ